MILVNNNNNNYYNLFSQIQMHQCAIECCKDPSKNMESLEVCNENCAKEVTAARNYVQNEFNKWQVCPPFVI